MSLVSRLERRFRRFGIPNLIIYLIAGQAALLYIAALMPNGVDLKKVALDPSKVMDGEAWRLVTFLFVPPGIGPVLVIFYFLLLQLFGSTLENQWGVFRFNLYVFIGWLANVVAAFIAAAVVGQQAAGGNQQVLQLAAITASNGFFYGSLFLAFARLYPDYIFNIFFVLPIRIRWLALLAWIGYGYALIRGNWMERMLVLATVLNYLLFFGREHWQEFRHGHRRRSFQTKAKRALTPAKHTCEVCGMNSDESPRTLFRYCSKCAGQRCYCPDHIRDHEHVVEGEPVA